MKDRIGRGLRPRVHPQMNTDTRRHAEKTSYHRKSKYKEDLLESQETGGEDEREDLGVLSDFKDVEADDEDEQDNSRGPSSGRR